MDSSLYEFLEKFLDNWQEIDLLVVEAKDKQDSNPALYKALCRSITVFTIAHLKAL
ncbi:hypothetical protein [Hydrogenovibrio sp. JE_KL2]|uniref:hypothetical protein n=1 Tax=Hydrogenovibrio sp. JE_KL2 TaxID=2651188 RepID=UPI001561DF0D|nr:hypothetical protein [Hydrogenovibrio sp. JE_KL2]